MTGNYVGNKRVSKTYILRKKKSRTSGNWNLHLSIRLGVALRAVADEDHLALWQPLVDLLHPADFVLLRPQCQVRQQARNAHPAGIAKDELAVGIVLVPETAQKRVQVVR